MKKFLKSNTFYAIVSLITAILLWIYVVYSVKPTYETVVSNVPVSCINISELFDSGSISIVGENANLLNEGISVDIKIKGKRSAVSSIRKSDINCVLDLITVNKSGSYNLKPNIYTDRSGIDIVRCEPGNIKFKVESIEQKDVQIELKTRGNLPEGYEIENCECKNTSVKITGPESVISGIAKADVTLDYSSLDKSDTEKSLEIMFYDAAGKSVNMDGVSKSVGYAKVTFGLYTEKNVKVRIVPRYKDDIRKNSSGKNVYLVSVSKGVSYDDGLETNVTLRGTSAAMEKYIHDVCTVYTEPIDISNIYSDKVLSGIKAASLSSDVYYKEVPEIDVKAYIKE